MTLITSAGGNHRGSVIILLPKEDSDRLTVALGTAGITYASYTNHPERVRSGNPQDFVEHALPEGMRYFVLPKASLAALRTYITGKERFSDIGPLLTRGMAGHSVSFENDGPDI